MPILSMECCIQPNTDRNQTIMANTISISILCVIKQEFFHFDLLFFGFFIEWTIAYCPYAQRARAQENSKENKKYKLNAIIIAHRVFSIDIVQWKTMQ